MACFLLQTDSDIQALFMGIDGLCKKYSKETSQVSCAVLSPCSGELLSASLSWRLGL